ncbi:MAG: histidine phosphatase family protein [Dongiaceae bacterium]
MLYLVRHGETVWNAAGRYQGQKDSPLTVRGREQGASIGRILANVASALEKPLRAYISPLGRARETAAIMGQYLALDCVDEPRVTEVTIGPWDGMIDYEIESEYPGALGGTDAFNWYFRSPGGERFEDVLKRISDWLSEVQTPAVVISHGLIGRIVRGIYLGMPKREMLELAVPQNGLYVLDAGSVRFLAEADVRA